MSAGFKRSQRYSVTNRFGLDARTIVKTFRMVQRLEARFYLEYEDQKRDLEDLMGILALTIPRSGMITITCDGPMNSEMNILFAPIIEEGLLTPVDDGSFPS